MITEGLYHVDAQFSSWERQKLHTIALSGDITYYNAHSVVTIHTGQKYIHTRSGPIRALIERCQTMTAEQAPQRLEGFISCYQFTLCT